MSSDQAPRTMVHSKFVGTSQAAEWIRDTLGLDPAMVGRVVVIMDAGEAARIEITRFVTPAELARLHISDVEAAERG